MDRINLYEDDAELSEATLDFILDMLGAECEECKNTTSNEDNETDNLEVVKYERKTEER